MHARGSHGGFTANTIVTLYQGGFLRFSRPFKSLSSIAYKVYSIVQSVVWHNPFGQALQNIFTPP
jgi:hypothetical protein